LLVFDTESGKTIQRLPVIGDCDDVFYDRTRKRIYASGGDGGISVSSRRMQIIMRIPSEFPR